MSFSTKHKGKYVVSSSLPAVAAFLVVASVRTSTVDAAVTAMSPSFSTVDEMEKSNTVIIIRLEQ